MELTQILQKALEIGGSDIFLIPGSAATAKVKGHLVQLTEEKLLPADTADMIREAYGMAGDHSDELLHRDGDDDFSFSFNRQARFRCNAYKQRGTLAATCRVVTFGLPDPDALHIPPMVIDLVSSCRNGMVLVTGRRAAARARRSPAWWIALTPIRMCISSPSRTQSNISTPISARWSASGKFPTTQARLRGPCARPCAKRRRDYAWRNARL